jgi:hypothetical protein
MELGKHIESPRRVPIDVPGLLDKIIVSPLALSDYRASVESPLNAASVSLAIYDSTLR